MSLLGHNRFRQPNRLTLSRHERPDCSHPHRSPLPSCPQVVGALGAAVAQGGLPAPLPVQSAAYMQRVEPVAERFSGQEAAMVLTGLAQMSARCAGLYVPAQ